MGNCWAYASLDKGLISKRDCCRDLQRSSIAETVGTSHMQPLYTTATTRWVVCLLEVSQSKTNRSRRKKDHHHDISLNKYLLKVLYRLHEHVSGRNTLLSLWKMSSEHAVIGSFSDDIIISNNLDSGCGYFGISPQRDRFRFNAKPVPPIFKTWVFLFRV